MSAAKNSRINNRSMHTPRMPISKACAASTPNSGTMGFALVSERKYFSFSKTGLIAMIAKISFPGYSLERE